MIPAFWSPPVIVPIAKGMRPIKPPPCPGPGAAGGACATASPPNNVSDSAWHARLRAVRRRPAFRIACATREEPPPESVVFMLFPLLCYYARPFAVRQESVAFDHGKSAASCANGTAVASNRTPKSAGVAPSVLTAENEGGNAEYDRSNVTVAPPL